MEGRNASSGSPSDVSGDHKRGDGEDSSDRRGNNQERISSDSSRHSGERRLNVEEIVITMITLVASIATSGNGVVHDQSWMTSAAIVQSGSFIPPPPPPPSAAPAPTPTRVINANNDAIPPPEEGRSSAGQLPPKKRKRAEHQVLHECGICGKVFSTGQALGGHMRAHYPGHLSRTRRANSNVAIASSAAASAAPSYPGVTINNNNNNNTNNNNNVINSEVDAEVNDESTAVEYVANEPTSQAASHPRLDIDLNVKPAEMMSGEDQEEPADENLEEEGHHSYGD